MLLKSRKVAYLGLLLAINQVFVIYASILEFNSVFLYTLAALIISIVIIEYGIKSGIVFYVASCILGFFLTGSRLSIFIYIIMLGSYTIFKYFIEKLFCSKNITVILEILAKLIVMNVLIFISYVLFRTFVNFEIQWWMIIVLQIGLLMYDYSFSGIINYYYKKIRNKLKIKK